MSSWEFHNAPLLALSALAPIVFWLASRAPGAVTFSNLDLLRKLPKSWKSRLAPVPPLLLALATVSLAVALAGPRIGDSDTRIKREGIAIGMVVDRSGSMRALDFVRDGEQIDRLEVVKEVFREFVLGGSAGDGRPDDLIGLIGFARYADGLCPLTLDHANLVQILDDVQIAGLDEDGTGLGEGLGLAVERLLRYPGASKVAILLTDGVSNVGDLEPLQAAELAAANDVKVYCIGIGSTGTAPFPQLDRQGRVITGPGGRARQRPMRVELDEKTLKAIADRTGGRYYNARTLDGLSDVYREIDQLERREIEELRYLQYRELYDRFAILALALVAAATILGSTTLRRLP
ncbi:MAG: VWA domain-containing protein [Planctomycetota bacterium]